MVNELNEFKNKSGDVLKIAKMDEPGDDEMDHVKTVREIIKNILEFVETEDKVLEDLTKIGWNKLSLNNLKNCEGGTLEETCGAILRFSDDLFYFLQRLSVSQSIFLEEFYKQAENERLQKLNKFVI